MAYHKVIHQKVTSADGKVVAEATSRVAHSDSNQTAIKQDISVRVTSTSSSSRSSSSSSSHSRE